MSSALESRRELGGMLAQLRHQASMSGRQLATRSSISQSKLSRIESGYGPISRADLRVMLDLLDADDHARAQAERLFNSIFDQLDSPEDLLIKPQRFAELERAAKNISVMVSSMVPALLQTEAYAIAVVNSVPTWIDESIRSDALVTRLARQAQLRDVSKSFRFIVGAGTLTQYFTSPRDHAVQMRAILEHNSRPNVEIRCLQQRAPLPRVPDTNFTIIDEDVVLVDGLNRIDFHEGGVEVMAHLDHFEAFWKDAIGGEELEHLIQAEISLIGSRPSQFEVRLPRYGEK